MLEINLKYSTDYKDMGRSKLGTSIYFWYRNTCLDTHISSLPGSPEHPNTQLEAEVGLLQGRGQSAAVT